MDASPRRSAWTLHDPKTGWRQGVAAILKSQGIEVTREFSSKVELLAALENTPPDQLPTVVSADMFGDAYGDRVDPMDVSRSLRGTGIGCVFLSTLPDHTGVYLQSMLHDSCLSVKAMDIAGQYSASQFDAAKFVGLVDESIEDAAKEKTRLERFAGGGAGQKDMSYSRY